MLYIVNGKFVLLYYYLTFKPVTQIVIYGLRKITVTKNNVAELNFVLRLSPR